MAKIFVMTGLSGAGKSTFAEMFAAANGYRYISIDDFYKYINGSDKNRSHKFEVWTACFRAIHLAERDGVDVVMDTNAPNAYERSDFIRWFNFSEHHLIYIKTDPQYCLENNRKRSRVVPDEWMHNLISTYEAPHVNEMDMWDSISVIENDRDYGFSLPKPMFFNSKLPEELKDFDANI